MRGSGLATGRARHPRSVAVAAAALVGVTTWLDVVLPAELEMDLFYFIPIALAGWWSSGAAAALVVVLATTGDLAAASSARDLGLLPLAWDAPTRLAIFGGAAALMWQLRRDHDEAVALALRDALTGIANRRLLLDRAERAVALSLRGTPSALLSIDLDGFKQVNDRLGHAAGDELLRQVASRLVGCVRIGDTVARLGGDEFVVLLPQTGAVEAHAIRDRITAAMGVAFDLRGRTVPTGASVGLALCPSDGADVVRLLAAADGRMYEAKRGASRAAGAHG